MLLIEYACCSPPLRRYSKSKEFWDRTERATRRDCLYAVPLGKALQERLALGRQAPAAAAAAVAQA